MNTKVSKQLRKIIKPAPLLTGQAVRVISPAGPAEKTRLEAGLGQLRRWGYRPEASRHAGGHHIYLSGPDPERLDDLIQAFSDPTVQAILCSRGGYGSGRLLSKIPFDLITSNPKIFVGFSDITALSWAFYARAGLVSFSGPIACEIGNGLPEPSQKSLLAIIGPGQPPDPIWKGALTTVRPGSASGSLFPGCLSIIVTLLGTPYLPDLEGAILLIEDVGEKPYRVDRMLNHLKNAGVLDRISALLVGSMTGCWPRGRRGNHLALEEILLELTSANPIPIYTGLPYGHHPNRITLPVGVRVEISEKGGLRLLEDPLSRR